MTTISNSTPLPVPEGGYRVQGADGKDGRVSERHNEQAAEIDRDRDGLCSDTEIESFMRQERLIKDPRFSRGDVPKLVGDYKTWLQDAPRPEASEYQNLDEMVSDLKSLAEKRPDITQLISLGKTFEGRDIWALKISQGAQGDTSHKPGVVYTGLHHAREWISGETTMNLANTLVNGYDTDPTIKQRVDGAEIWVIPVANPDGYEYSRSENSWWRKNRNPITDTECPTSAAMHTPAENSATPAELVERVRQEQAAKPQPEANPPVAYGVDLNRNYFDGDPDHFYLYRTDRDKPCNTYDDWGASDSPRRDDYRGPHAASELEVQALQQFEYHRPNIKGIIDHHAYGELLLRPWGNTMTPPPDVKEYDEIADRMQKAQVNKYDYEASASMYATTGSSENSHQVNGIKTFTIEMARSFQPSASEFDAINRDVNAADLAFLDWVIERYPATPPVPSPEPPPADPTGPGFQTT